METTHPSGIALSWWLRDRPVRQRFDRLTDRHTTEILVIGAGITGLSTAIELAERGHQVTVCESNAIGAGTTANSTGHLDAHPEMGPYQLLKQLGRDAAADYVALRLAAIQEIESRCAGNCEFERISGYHYSESLEDREELEQNFKAAEEIGLNVKWTEQIPIPHAGCGYEVEGMARIHCSKYLDRLVEIASRKGVTIFEETMVEGPTESEVHQLKAGDGTVEFQHVISAVHCNYTGSMRLYAATPPYQSYAIVAEVNNPPADALFWDNSEPYYYVRRAQSDHPSLIIAGGCDHRTGTEDTLAAFGQLEQWLRERFEVTAVVHRWSAELFEPTDGLPMIGQVASSRNVWIATGLSGVGLTLGTAAARMLADQIEGKPCPLEDELSPSRLAISSPVKYGSEQAATTANFAERVLPAGNVNADELHPGEGRVGNVDGAHTAICRTHDGCLHRSSPICTHMGGVLHWNEAEQTWDCPVHGGRFTPDGTRLYGPPESDLKSPGE
ncbi:MAG: oxidoreductase [Planctomyces sp.]|nr:oxidoreductase [Planctomyces sp.]